MSAGTTRERCHPYTKTLYSKLLGKAVSCLLGCNPPQGHAELTAGAECCQTHPEFHRPQPPALHHLSNIDENPIGYRLLSPRPNYDRPPSHLVGRCSCNLWPLLWERPKVRTLLCYYQAYLGYRFIIHPSRCTQTQLLVRKKIAAEGDDNTHPKSASLRDPNPWSTRMLSGLMSACTSFRDAMCFSAAMSCFAYFWTALMLIPVFEGAGQRGRTATTTTISSHHPCAARSSHQDTYGTHVFNQMGRESQENRVHPHILCRDRVPQCSCPIRGPNGQVYVRLPECVRCCTRKWCENDRVQLLLYGLN